MRPATALHDVSSLQNTTLLQSSVRSAGSWPVHRELTGLLPGGLPKGGTVLSAGSVSLLLALLGAASADGAWCAIAGLPSVGAEAAAEFGVALSRTPIVAGPPQGSGRAWAGLIAALIDAVDVVAARPGTSLAAGDVSRLAARARTKQATLLLHSDRTDRTPVWNGADVRLVADDPQWQRADGPRGRLTARRITVTAQGRGRYGRPVTLGLWLPAANGGVA